MRRKALGWYVYGRMTWDESYEGEVEEVCVWSQQGVEQMTGGKTLLMEGHTFLHSPLSGLLSSETQQL